jgi:hypothetical protein
MAEIAAVRATLIPQVMPFLPSCYVRGRVAVFVVVSDSVGKSGLRAEHAILHEIGDTAL